MWCGNSKVADKKTNGQKRNSVWQKKNKQKKTNRQNRKLKYPQSHLKILNLTSVLRDQLVHQPLRVLIVLLNYVNWVGSAN